jgi:DNA-binding transcriptional LysR family regulator
VTLAKPKHEFATRKPNVGGFANAAHIEVDSLPALRLLDGALATHGETVRIASKVSSVLVGLLLVLNSDFLLTVPASLAAILEKDFELIHVAQPFEPATMAARLLWHSSYDRDECHQWVRDELVRLAREIGSEG